MNRYFVLLLLLHATQAKRSSIDVIYSSHTNDTAGLFPTEPSYNSSSAIGCKMAELNGDCFDARCCPSGTQCVQGDSVLGTVNTCRVLAKSVHQGTSGYDFESERIIKPDTQVDWLPVFTTEKADAEGTSGRQNEKDKYPLYKVALSDLTTPDKYVGCEVSLSGSLVDAAGIDGPVLNDTKTRFVPASGTENVSCEFMVLNKGYLGLIEVNVTFTKDPVLMFIGEKSIDSVEVHLRYVPGSDDDDWHDPTHPMWVSHGVGDILFPDHDRATITTDRYASVADDSTDSVFEFDKDSHGMVTIGAGKSALKGTLQLPVTGTFYDKRYKIVEQTGVESLLGDLGNGLMRKEGMEIHHDFKDFYTATNNVFDNSGINLQPVPLFASYKTVASIHAQYKLEHTYVMTYGGSFDNEMPHFSPSYLSCALCPARLVLKAFEKTDAYSGDGTEAEKTDYLLRYHVSVRTSDLPTSSNTFKLDDVNVEKVVEVDGHVAHGNAAIRLPTSMDPQYPDGHPLGDFFTVVKASTQKEFQYLTDDYDVINGRLSIVNGSANMSTGCTSGAGKVYEIRTDIVAKAQELFDETCRIEIGDGSFGDEIHLSYTAQDKTTNALIIKNDLRKIISGNTELSILRRKADSQATTNGPRVTFDVSQFGVPSGINFCVKGSNTMIGYGNDGSECTQAMVCNAAGLEYDGSSCSGPTTNETLINTGKQCKGVYDASETLVSVSATEGVSTSVTIRSSSDCFLYMDVELQDLDHPFASYGLRLPCVRTTAEIDDQLDLKYTFDTNYSLSDDLVHAEIGFHIPAGQGLTVASYGFGTCGSDHSLVTVQSCSPTWTLSGETYQLDSDVNSKVTLADLTACGEKTDTDANYIISHSLALVYERDLTSDGHSLQKYCQSQEFITTIRRDASASITVATLVTPTLERSVMVSGISWVQCPSSQVECKGSEDCYKLQIKLNATEREVDTTAWSLSQLKDVFMPPDGVNTDDMTIVHDLSAENTGSQWMVESVCGVVYSCDDGAGTHYGDLSSGTSQDMIIRGTFDNVDVDTEVNIQTSFEECPLQADTGDLGGELLLGLVLSCEDGTGVNVAQRNVSSDVTDASGVVPNCAEAYADALAVVSSDIFLDGKNESGKTNADDRGWKFKNIDYKINRYEKDLLGEKDPSKLISSDLMMEIRHDGSQGDTGYTCTKKQSGLTGLANSFNGDILTCPDPTGTITEDMVSKFSFDLRPLQPVNMDVFEVEVIAVLKNDLLQRRHLRATFRLRTDGSVDEKTNGLTVLPLDDNTDNNDVDDSVDDAKDHHKEIHEHVHTIEKEQNTSNIILYIGVGAVLVIVIVLLIVYFACKKKKDSSEARGGAGPDEETERMLPSREQRVVEFKNLRY